MANLSFIIDVDDVTGSGHLRDFLSRVPAPQGAVVRGDVQLPLDIRPVVGSESSERPWDDDWLDTDLIRVAIGLPDQEPVAYAEPATTKTAANCAASITTIGNATQNKVYTITFTDGTYGGRYTVASNAAGTNAACGYAKPRMSASELGFVLAKHPNIEYRSSDGAIDNVSVSKDGPDFLVEFVGDLGFSNTPTLYVADVDLLAPKGVTGTLNLNTDELADAFDVTGASLLNYTFEVQRERASGEIKTILSKPITLHRDIIDDAATFPSLGRGYWRFTNAARDVGVGTAWMVDTSDGAFQLLLTGTPIRGDGIKFADAKGTWGTSPCYINGNGRNIAGLSERLNCDADGRMIELIYMDVLTGWQLYNIGS